MGTSRGTENSLETQLPHQPHPEHPVLARWHWRGVTQGLDEAHLSTKADDTDAGALGCLSSHHSPWLQPVQWWAVSSQGVWPWEGEAGLWKQTVSISGSIWGEYCSTCSFFLVLPPKLDSINRGWERPVTIAMPLWEWKKSATEQAGFSSGSRHPEGKETE